MKTYGDLMWGGPPSLNREQLTPVDNKAGGAHFVLAGSDGKVAYNPWPEADGSAYVRAKDGDGAKVVAGEAGLGQLKGASVGSYRKELPSRS